MNNQYPFLENRAYSLRHSLTARNLLIFSVVMLIFIGLMMVASASMPYAEKEGLSAYNFIQKQGIFLMLSLLVGTLVYKFSGSFLNYSHSSVLLIGASLLGFILVLLVGKDIKGAKRWIDIGFFSVQVSEFVKFFWVLLLADFAVQRGKYIRKGVMYVQHFWVWLAALMVIIGLLAFQRDMGTVMAYVAISLAILFIAEIPWKELLISVAVVIMISAVGLLVADYRVSRILSVSN
ncbi:MAG: FtsW/RodA/SpoVE family cell cycle protein, partial [Acinetobacter sp.]|nr:FtsW/RodA/SpoVE family cell cycle protein [Acinetobacter sp.]